MKIAHCAEGVCRAHLEAREEHTNPNGVMHGGVLFSLADTAMGAALFSLLPATEICATIEIKMNFLKPVTEGLLTCEARVLRRGRTTAVLEARLENGGGAVAVALGTFAIFPRPASAAEPGP
jgi:acyl-CoA thioesterase